MRPTAIVVGVQAQRAVSRCRGVVRVGPGPVPPGAGRSVSPSRISQQVAYIALNMSESTDLMCPMAVVAHVDVSVGSLCDSKVISRATLEM